jgi:hypothetical protein
MKGITILAAAAAMLGLAGCNMAGRSDNLSANAASGNAAASSKPADGAAANAAAPQTADAGKLNAGGGAVPASSTGTAASGIRLDRTFIMGRWTDDGNCEKPTEFSQDGRFITPDGNTGLWNLDGDRLTLTGNRTIGFRVVPLDPNTINIVHDDGSLGHSTRC